MILTFSIDSELKEDSIVQNKRTKKKVYYEKIRWKTNRNFDRRWI